MSEYSLKLRVLLFLYSNANLAGLALALLGPVLLFAGFIYKGWLLITLAFYGCGYAIAQFLQPQILLKGKISDSLSLVETQERLIEIVEQAKPHLDEKMLGYLTHIVAMINDILPRIKTADLNDDAFTVREIVLRYLPETLANYVGLSPLYRTIHPVAGANGKTAKDVLTDQLALLEQKMGEIVINISNADAQSLVANGNFLKSKFQRNDFLAVDAIE